jgi:hypothetical protein
MYRSESALNRHLFGNVRPGDVVARNGVRFIALFRDGGLPRGRSARRAGLATLTIVAAVVLFAACGGHRKTPAPAPTSAPVLGGGAVAYPAPRTPYVVGAGQRYTSVQSAIDAAPEGAVIYIKNGTYREEVRPKTGQTLLGETRDGARIDGANAVGSSWWHRDGHYWYFQDPWPLVGRTVGSWDGVTPDIDAQSNDLLHRDDIPLLHKMKLSQVGAGDFYVDYRSKRLYVADNPAGHRFQLSVRPVGIGDGTRDAKNVTIENLTVEKTATAFNQAGIEMNSGWVVKDCLVLGNHGRGISTTVDDTIAGTAAPLVGSYPGGGARTSAQRGRAGSMQVVLSGSLGIGGSGSLGGQPDRFGHPSGNDDSPGADYDNNIHITNTDVGWSNVERFSYWDEGGGVKLSLRNGVTLDGDWIHDSYGPGAWFDTANRNIEVTNSLFADNLAAGVWYEANPGPYQGGITIEKSTFRRNGNTSLGRNRDFQARGQYSGIFLSDSADVVVRDNFIQVGTVGGFGIAEHYGGRTKPANYTIEHNVISIGIPTAAIGFGADGSNFTFDYNTVLTWGTVTPKSTLYSLGSTTFASWRSKGRDVHGAIAASASPPSD